MSDWPTDPHSAPRLASSALVVIDVQHDFLDCGASPIPGTTDVLPALAALVTAYRDAGRPVVHVVRLYDGADVDLPRRTAVTAGAPIVRPGTPGTRIPEALLPDAAPELDAPGLLAGRLQPLGPREWVMWKPRWGAFHRTPLERHLRDLDVDTVVVAGCNFPNCPRATLYGASERDLRALVVRDAVSGFREHHEAETRGIGVHVAPVADVLRRLGR